MRSLRIYVDTSVIGGCLDIEFSVPSQQLIEAVKNKKVMMLLSELVISELANAPPDVRAILTSLPAEVIENVPLSEEIIALRDAYITTGVVTTKSINDAAHVAAATVARADAIVSWNFKHIVRLDKMRAYNQVNLLNGYGILTIVSPREVIFDESDEN